MRNLKVSKPAIWITPFLLMVSILCGAQAPLPEPVTDQETELGLAVYNELRDKGEIIASSPLYDSLRPVVEAISRVAQSRYPHPFKFFLVHEPRPNAFATPGGNVYVVDSIAVFREEHRTTGRNPLSRSLAHDSPRRHGSHQGGTEDQNARARRCDIAGTNAG